MNGYEIAEKTLNEIYIGLIGWIQRWVPAPHADALAATCMSHLVRDAMVGSPTSHGPYRLLYQNAEFQMRWWSQGNGYVVPFGIWRTIPVPLPELLCDLARTYANIHTATELAQISLPEQDLLARMMDYVRYDVEGHWIMPVGDSSTEQVRAIVYRAVHTLDNHECAYLGECQEFADLWAREDTRSARWLAEFRHHARTDVHGF